MLIIVVNLALLKVLWVLFLSLHWREKRQNQIYKHASACFHFSRAIAKHILPWMEDSFNPFCTRLLHTHFPAGEVLCLVFAHHHLLVQWKSSSHLWCVFSVVCGNILRILLKKPVNWVFSHQRVLRDANQYLLLSFLVFLGLVNVLPLSGNSACQCWIWTGLLITGRARTYFKT